MRARAALAGALLAATLATGDSAGADEAARAQRAALAGTLLAATLATGDNAGADEAARALEPGYAIICASNARVRWFVNGDVRVGKPSPRSEGVGRRAHGAEALVRAVRTMLREGWRTTGGVERAFMNRKWVWCQALERNGGTPAP